MQLRSICFSVLTLAYALIIVFQQTQLSYPSFASDTKPAQTAKPSLAAYGAVLPLARRPQLVRDFRDILVAYLEPATLTLPDGLAEADKVQAFVDGTYQGLCSGLESVLHAVMRRVPVLGEGNRYASCKALELKIGGECEGTVLMACPVSRSPSPLNLQPYANLFLFPSACSRHPFITTQQQQRQHHHHIITAPIFLYWYPSHLHLSLSSQS